MSGKTRIIKSFDLQSEKYFQRFVNRGSFVEVLSRFKMGIQVTSRRDNENKKRKEKNFTGAKNGMKTVSGFFELTFSL